MSNAAGAPAASTDPSTPTSGGDARDTVEAELAALMKDRAGREEPTATPEKKPETEAEKPKDGDEPGEDKELAEADGQPEKKADDKPDPKTARGLEAIAREKKRFEQEKAQTIQRVQQMVAKLESDQKQHEQLLQSAQRWQASLKADVFSAVLDALPDLTAQDADLIARQFYAHAKAPGNPELRAQAEARRRAATTASETATLKAELEALKQERAQERQQQERQQQVQQYLGAVEAAIGEDTPLLLAAMKAEARETRRELYQVADDMATRQGYAPDPGDVAKEWERRQRSHLKRLGIEPGAKPAAQKPNPVADEKPRPKQTPINSELGTQVRPRSTPKTPEEEDAEVLRELEARMRAGD